MNYLNKISLKLKTMKINKLSKDLKVLNILEKILYAKHKIKKNKMFIVKFWIKKKKKK